MADYWKSNEKQYCKFCNCWISDNKASTSFHNNGKRHKMNVAKHLAETSRNSERAEKERKQMDAEIRKMENAAMSAYARDIHSRGDFTAKTLGMVMQSSTAGPPPKPSISSNGDVRQTRQQDPMRLPGNSDDEDENCRVLVSKVDPETVPNASLWVEGKSDDGYTYYWNVKTNESVWEEPKEGYLSWSEYQRINEIALKQQEIKEEADAKKFRENVNEEVAKYNREKLKYFRKPETIEEKKAKQEKKESYKTEEEAATQQIGSWQVVENKPPPAPVDLELPQVDNYYIPPVISEEASQPVPPVKRFKEKTLSCLDPSDVAGVATTFKKRKFANKSNARTRLNDD